MSSAYSQIKDVQDLQVMDQSTARTTFEAPGGATAATYVGQSPLLQFVYDKNLVRNHVTGTRDAAHVMATMTSPILGMDLPNLQSPESIAFLKRGFNLENGAGTIERLFSAVLRQKMGTTQYYLELASGMIAGGIIGVMGPGNWWARSLLIPCALQDFTTVAPTNWTFVTPPTTALLMSKGALASHVTVRDVDAGVNYTPSVRGVAIAFNNSPEPVIETGVNTWSDQVPGPRQVEVRYIFNRKDKNIFDICKSEHEVNSTIIIQSAPAITITVTGGKMSPATWDFGLRGPLPEGIVHSGKVASLAGP